MNPHPVPARALRQAIHPLACACPACTRAPIAREPLSPARMAAIGWLTGCAVALLVDATGNGPALLAAVKAVLGVSREPLTRAEAVLTLAAILALLAAVCAAALPLGAIR